MTISDVRNSKRTIVLDSDIEEKLRRIRGHLISNDTRNWSLSKIVNILLLTGLVSSNKLDVEDLRVIKEHLEKKKISIDGKTLEEISRKIGNFG